MSYVLIDEKGLRNEILNYFTTEMNRLAEYFKNIMIQNIEDIPDRGSYYAVGALDWRQDVADYIDQDFRVYKHMLVARFGLLNHHSDDDNLLKQAMLINYGMGKYLDSSNPSFKDYVNSEYYDKKRVGHNVYTRPGEEVYDYETETYGWMDSVATIRYEIPYFKQFPSHFYTDNILDEMDDEFKRVVDNFVNVVDVFKYFRFQVR